MTVTTTGRKTGKTIQETVLPPTESGSEAEQSLTQVAFDKAVNKKAAQIVTQEPAPEKKDKPNTSSAGVIVTPEQVEQMINARLEQAEQQRAQAKADKKAARELEEMKAELERTKQELAAAKEKEQIADQQMDNLAAVTGMKGRSENYNSDTLNQFTSRTDRQPTLVKEMLDLVASAPKHIKNYEGLMFSQPDAGVVDEMIENYIFEAKAKYNRPYVSVREFAQLPLVQEMTQYGKQNGLFLGPNAPAAALNAGVTSSDMIGGFLPILSSLLRFTHRGGYVFWQFPNIAIDHGRNRGDTIQIPRYALNEEPTSDSDWLLSGGGTWADLSTDSQGTSTGVVEAVIKEYGTGKSGVDANRPYVVPNFVQMYSALSVLESFSVNLMRNYMQFEDRYIRGLWTPTSRIVYNKSNEVETTVGNLVTGSNGTLTVEYLHQLYSYMRSLLIPTYMDGCYGLVICSKQLSQLRKSVATITEAEGFTKPQNASDLASLVNILPALNDIDRVSGYRGQWGNFHIFEQNTFAMGASGTPGVQNVNTGLASPNTAKLTRSAYAFGSDSIARGTGMPMEVRSQSGEIRWNRDQRFIWISHESFTALDVDPTGYSDTSDVPQQLRVIQVRTLDTPI